MSGNPPGADGTYATNEQARELLRTSLEKNPESRHLKEINERIGQ